MHFRQVDQDVITGGSGPRSRRSVLIVIVVASVLAGGLLRHQFTAETAPPRHEGGSSTAGRPATWGPAVASGPASFVQPANGLILRPHARGSDLAFRRLYRSLPLAASGATRPAAGNVAFRVQHRPGSSGGVDFGAVAQVREAAGWVDVASGDIGSGQLDATRSRVAFMVRLPSLSESKVSTWAYVVSVSRAVVLATLAIPSQAQVAGWFGGQVVIDRSAIGLAPLLLDATGRKAPRGLEAGISVVADGMGDVQFVGSGLDRCLTGWRLGLAPRPSQDRCPNDAIMAVSPQGRWAVTRDLRWLDESTGRSIQLTGRPFRWPVDSVDFVDERRTLVLVDVSGQTLKIVCSPRDGCQRLPS